LLLNCHTYYSYKFGTISIEQLITDATGKGYNSLVLTDINNTSACIDFVSQCSSNKLKPILGIDFRNGVKQRYIGIAKDNEGFMELNCHLTDYLHSGKSFPEKAPEFKKSYIIYPFEHIDYQALEKNEFVGIKPSQLGHLKFSEWKNHQNKLVILQSVIFRHKQDFNIHRLLRAIGKNKILSRLPKTEEASPDEIMFLHGDILEKFREYPQIIENTNLILNSCSISFEFKTPKNKKTFTSSEDDDFELLKEESLKGLEYRYKNPSQKVVERMEKELSVIKQLNFCSYFLINWDLVRYARQQSCYYVGRGSGANSMIAYLLRITDVDPIELDLYFERFINPSRTNPPDFDIDFASRDRNKIIKYLFDRYGWEYTALVGTYITFQFRSMIREIGKVFGLPSDEIDKLQKVKNFNLLDEIELLVLKYSKLIHGFPSHLSVHSSGIIISEEPISTYTSTIIPPKGFPTIHFSMLEAEDLGFAKFDILGQRGLSKIEDTIAIVKKNTNCSIDIHDLERFKTDEKVKELLKHGKTIGCFYVESPAMRMLLTKLEADDYLRLVAASSIIRPGVSKSGMMNEYILRYRDTRRRKAAENEMPELYLIMKETYGVMVYQEDVIKVAHYFAGLTLTEADVLRRGMSWKFKQRNEFGKIKDKFFFNCKERNYPLHIVERVWTQIESFANYAFSKGHSASYAVESFQALYLKAYYPLEYMVATLNNGGGFYSKEVYIHEARMHGAQIELPCVNKSLQITTIEGKVIYLGLDLIGHLETDTARLMLQERLINGPFDNLRDFMKRVPVSLEQLTLLIRMNSFRFTGKNKKELMWDANFILKKDKVTNSAKTLFNENPKEFVLPSLYAHPLEQAYDEFELIGFPISISPFKLIRNMPETRLLAKDLVYMIDKHIDVVGYLVTIKKTLTSSGKTMSFGVFIDLEGQWIDTVQFPSVVIRYPFRGPGCYLIKGKIVKEFGFVSIETSELYKLDYINMEEPSTRLKKLV